MKLLFIILLVFSFSAQAQAQHDINARANPMFDKMYVDPGVLKGGAVRRQQDVIYLTNPPMVVGAQQPIPQVEVPVWPGPEPVPWVPWSEPECPQVVEDEPGYLEVLWGVVHEAFRFILAPDITGVALNSTIATDGDTIISYSPGTFVRADDGHLRVVIYAWDEKKKELSPTKLADDGGLDIKGGQTVYVKWLYGNDTSILGPVLRLKDLKWEVRKLRAVNAALCAWLLEYQIPPGAGGGSPSWNALRKACGK